MRSKIYFLFCLLLLKHASSSPVVIDKLQRAVEPPTDAVQARISKEIANSGFRPPLPTAPTSSLETNDDGTSEIISLEDAGVFTNEVDDSMNELEELYKKIIDLKLRNLQDGLLIDLYENPTDVEELRMLKDEFDERVKEIRFEIEDSIIMVKDAYNHTLGVTSTNMDSARLDTLRTFQESLEILLDQKEALQLLVDAINALPFHDDQESIPIDVTGKIGGVEKNNMHSDGDNVDKPDDDYITDNYDYKVSSTIPTYPDTTPTYLDFEELYQEFGNGPNYDSFNSEISTTIPTYPDTDETYSDNEEIYLEYGNGSNYDSFNSEISTTIPTYPDTDETYSDNEEIYLEYGNGSNYDSFDSGELEISDEVDDQSDNTDAESQDEYDYSSGDEQPIDEYGALVEPYRLNESPYHQSNEENDAEEYYHSEEDPRKVEEAKIDSNAQKNSETDYTMQNPNLEKTSQDLGSSEFQTSDLSFAHELLNSANKLGKLGSTENVFDAMELDPFDDSNEIPDLNNIEGPFNADLEISKSPSFGDVSDPYQASYNEVMDMLDEMNISPNGPDQTDILGDVNEQENLFETVAAKPDLMTLENDYDSDSFSEDFNNLDKSNSDDTDNSNLRNLLLKLYNNSPEDQDGELFNSLDTGDDLQNIIDEILKEDSIADIKATSAPGQIDIDSLLNTINKEYSSLDEVESNDSGENYEDRLIDYAELRPTSIVQTEDGIEIKSPNFVSPFDFENHKSPEVSNADDNESLLEYYFAAAGFVKDKSDLATASEKLARYYGTEKTAIENAKTLILVFVAVFVVFAVALLLVLYRFRRNSKLLIATRVPYKIMEEDAQYFDKKMPILKETTKNVYSIDI